MKRFNFLSKTISLVLVSQLLSINVSNGAQISTNLIREFNNYLINSQNTYQKLTQELQANYLAQTSEANVALSNALKEFSQVNKIKVLKLGDNRNYWGSFNCPPERPDCIAIDKGEAFKVGEITTIKDSVTKNISFLDEIAVIKNLGLIQLLDETNFNRVAKQIKDQTNALANLKMAYEQDMALAKKSLDDALIFSYAVETAKIAAKRANLNASIYEKAFLTAFIFEYNRDGLDRLATKPWSSINNLKALDSAVKITRLSQQADEIDSKYNFKSATLLNNLCGKVFINEASYKRDFSFISKLYLKVTKKKL